jgi:Tfp pilus assembly protein PilF
MKFIISTLSIIALCSSLVGCETKLPSRKMTETPEQPAEKALMAGIRSYEEAQYVESEKHLIRALQLGLADPLNKASAHKHLAFIYCSTRRTVECENSFKAALQADPGFSLSKSEAGHPLWAPVYQRLRPQ